MLFSLLLALCTGMKGQNTITIFTGEKSTAQPLPGVTARIDNSAVSGMSDSSGIIVLKNIPGGKQLLRIAMLGYAEIADTISFPRATADTLRYLMEEEAEEMEEVVITSTRSTRSIEDIPTRVEFIAGEELEEKANMKPGDIRMVLSESTGIQVQQTSATSGNASIRIQGLDGRYTQLLKDGFPLYSGYAGGLGLLQTPPLDLKQVEVVKGSASTLYGGGAIAGLVNLISKSPSEERELKFVFNGTTAGGFDGSGYFSKMGKKIGTTVFGAYNYASPYDPAKIDLTAIPKYQRYTLNPKLFFIPSEKTKVVFGVNAAAEDRTGGDIHYIRGKGDSLHAYFEKNSSRRISSQLSWEQKLFGKVKLALRNSVNYIDRAIAIPGYDFTGKQLSTFSEANFNYSAKNTEWIYGANLWTDRFAEQRMDTFPRRDFDQLVSGIFIQNTFKAGKIFSAETGLRADFVKDYGPVLLPRLSLLFRFNEKITSRLGGGLGYKLPSIFTEESERLQYRNILPPDFDSLKTERSYGANWDFNYRTSFFDRKITFSINQLFFYTALFRPLYLQARTDGLLEVKNSDGRLQSRGAETNIKFGYKDVKLYAGYTFTDARVYYADSVTKNFLTPSHRVNLVMMYEVEEKFKLGIEGYYFSPQKLSDGRNGVDYWLCGIMGERTWEKFSAYINFENVLNVRQTKNDFIFYGTKTNPVFRDIYAPLDGFVINGGIKLRL